MRPGIWRRSAERGNGGDGEIPPQCHCEPCSAVAISRLAAAPRLLAKKGGKSRLREAIEIESARPAFLRGALIEYLE